MPIEFYGPREPDARPKYRPPGRPKRNRAQINARRRAARRNR